MRSGPKRLTGLVAVAASALLVAAACGTSSSTKTPAASGDFADCKANPNTCNTGTRVAGGTMVAISEKTIVGWNVNDGNASTFDLAQIVTGLLPAAFLVNPDLSITLNTDLLESATETSTAPQTIVYKIKQNAVWDDGTPIDAKDFIYAWKSEDGVAADCDPKLCVPASTAGYNLIKSVDGSPDGKTVTVVFKTPFTDWNSLFGIMYPAHVADSKGGVGAGWKYFNENQPTFSGGPYIIAPNGYEKDASVTLVPNPKWYGAIKPTLQKLVYKIITDQTAEVPALQNGEVNEIYPQPTQDIVSQVQGMTGVKAMLGKGLVWEHLDLNLGNTTLGGSKPDDPAKIALRTAIFTAVDRKQILDRTIGSFDKDVDLLGSHNFVPAQKAYKDFITPTTQGKGDINKAKSLLTTAGYKFDSSGKLLDPSGAAVPALRIAYTTGNTNRQITSQLVQASLQKIGITVNIVPTQDLGGTLQNGDYDMIIFAWVGTPSVEAGAYQLWTINGGGDYNKWDNAEATKDMNDAAASTDVAKADELLNSADQLLTNDAVVLPLFQKPTYLAVNTNVVGIRDNPTNAGPAYNNQAWGLSNLAK
jgi:peptide/nickel transport system substrate-binding protein